MASLFPGIFLFITLPAPIFTLFPIFTGAISEEFEPINDLLPIIVLFFLIPS
jgi:hypothetical protein